MTSSDRLVPLDAVSHDVAPATGAAAAAAADAAPATGTAAARTGGDTPPLRTVLVTGASSGIGRATALALAGRGHQVIATGRDPQRLQSLVAESPTISVMPADLRDTDGLAGFVHGLLKAHPGLDAVIHNAAVQYDLRLDDLRYDLPALEDELRTNLAAPIELTRLLLPRLRGRPSAVLVYVTTGLAFAPKSSASVYCATKAGLQAFADSLRGQLADSAVRVAEVVPPLTDTPMTEGRGRGKASPKTVATAVVAALEGHSDRVYAGKARLLPALMRLAPGFTRRRMLRG